MSVQNLIISAQNGDTAADSGDGRPRTGRRERLHPTRSCRGRVRLTRRAPVGAAPFSAFRTGIEVTPRSKEAPQPAARRPPTFLRRVTSAGLRATEHVASVWCGGDRPRRAGAAAAAGTDTAGPGAPSAGRSGVSLAASFAVTPRRSSEDPLPLSRAPTLSLGSRRGLLPSAAPATRLPRRGHRPVVGSRATLETCRCEMRLRPEAAPPGRRSRPARERPAEFPSGPPGLQPSQPSHPLAPPAPPPSPRSWPVFPTPRSPPPEPAAPPAPRAPPDSPSGTRHPLLVPPGAQTPGAATDSFEQRTHLSRPQLPRKYKITMAPATRGGKEKRKRVSSAAQ